MSRAVIESTMEYVGRRRFVRASVGLGVAERRVGAGVLGLRPAYRSASRRRMLLVVKLCCINSTIDCPRETRALQNSNANPRNRTASRTRSWSALGASPENWRWNRHYRIRGRPGSATLRRCGVTCVLTCCEHAFENRRMQSLKLQMFCTHVGGSQHSARVLPSRMPRSRLFGGGDRGACVGHVG